MTRLHDTGELLSGPRLSITTGRGEYDPEWLAKAHATLVRVQGYLDEYDRRMAEVGPRMDFLLEERGSVV